VQNHQQLSYLTQDQHQVSWNNLWTKCKYVITFKTNNYIILIISILCVEFCIDKCTNILAIALEPNGHILSCLGTKLHNDSNREISILKIYFETFIMYLLLPTGGETIKSGRSLPTAKVHGLVHWKVWSS
jgi:hypothetical protein